MHAPIMPDCRLAACYFCVAARCGPRTQWASRSQDFGHVERDFYRACRIGLRLAWIGPTVGSRRAADGFFERQAIPNFHLPRSPATLARWRRPWHAQT